MVARPLFIGQYIKARSTNFRKIRIYPYGLLFIYRVCITSSFNEAISVIWFVIVASVGVSRLSLSMKDKYL